MKLLWKAIILIVILAGLNWVYTKTAWVPFLEAEAEQYLQVQKIKNCEVLYISESSNFPPAGIPEKDPRKISQFVSDFFPFLQFEAINKPASHAGTYNALLRLLPENSEVQTIIVTMNLRSFGASWIYSELETPLNKAMVMYNHRPPLLNRFLVSLNAYDNASPKEREESMLSQWSEATLPFPEPRNSVENWCAMEKWGDWQDPKRQLADQFIKQYAFVINEHNPRVKDFDEITDLARERGWNLVFNILAENTEKADSLAGPELVKLMRDNTQWLEARYQGRGVTVLNNLDKLASKHFTDKDFPTEHYDEEGRKTIAAEVAYSIEKFHAKETQGIQAPSWNNFQTQEK